MKKTLFLLPAVLFLVSGCILFDSPVGPDGRQIAPISSPPPRQSAHKKPATGKTAMPEAVESSMKHDPSLEPDKDVKPDPYASPARPVTSYPMNTDSIRSTSEAYRDLNSRRSTPDYLQTKPRERDPFYNEVNRTGSNPMNTQDRTTNRRVYP